MNLSYEEKDFLLSVARHSILSLFEETIIPAADFEKSPTLKINAGAFVTLTIDESLRGCIGFITTDKSLYETVQEAAQHAANNDPRFLPLNQKEFDDISIEISVLSPPDPIKEYEEIEIGKHGIILNESRRALLLPQVAVEHGMDREEFLSALCEKAGLYKFTWQERKMNLMVFTAEVFSEKERSKV